MNMEAEEDQDMCVDNIKVGLVELGLGDMGWIVLAQDRDKWRAPVKAVMNLQIPYIARKFFSRSMPGSLLGSTQLHRVS
jgi:hypothetical protein